MKKLFKILLIVLVISTLMSCEKKQDWTCVCRDTIVGMEISRSVITDMEERNAIKECDKKDFTNTTALGFDCSIEE